MEKVKSVLISHIGIPSTSIGSWNIMITNLIKEDPFIFDYIISPEPSFLVPEIKNFSVSNIPTVFNKIKFRFFRKPFLLKKRFWNQLNKILNKEDKVVVNIIDDIGILNSIDYYAKKTNKRNKIFINFFFHGYYFDLNLINVDNSYSIDRLILLTKTSYVNLLEKSTEVPFMVDILPNGIPSYFKPLLNLEKKQLKENIGFDTKTKYFLWLSQDRPKKGLNIILKAWSRVSKNHSNIELLVIGTTKLGKEGSVNYLGRVPNKDLPKYYQISDYFIFSTLCHEGHPLSLSEALKCGLKCIASNIQPIPEILDYGNLGFLIDYPNSVDSWVNGINFTLEQEYNFNRNNTILNNLYTFNGWTDGFKNIIESSKKYF